MNYREKNGLRILRMYIMWYGMLIAYSKSMNQPGMVANPARGQLNRENNIPLSPCVPENLESNENDIQ